MEFLQEIGCSKMQGYYYSKPISLEQILERYKTGTQIGFENPIEKNGVFKSRHRLLINGQPVPVNVRSVLINENGVDKLIMGIRKM